MPLHIDYRPASFDEIIGNQNTIDSLVSVLARDDKPHSILLQGPSGCGKTTLARIIASELKCHDQDLIEINMGNNRGIDTAREIIQTIAYKPVAGPVRVILLDEVGAAVKTFQEALLKPLEDTSDHVYFILATTDPEKLLKTVRNRCSTFDVNKLSDDEIEQLVNWVLTEEELKIAPDAKEMLIESSDGCPRQALVILDQIIDLPLDKQKETVREAAIGDKQVIDLCRALVKKERWNNIAEILKGLKTEPEKVRYAILGYMNTVLLGGDPNAAVIISIFKDPFFYSGKAGLALACWEAIE